MSENEMKLVVVGAGGRMGQALIRIIHETPGVTLHAAVAREGSPFIGTATQNPGGMVQEAIRIAQEMAAGNAPAERTVLIESVLVTRDNVGEYAGW